MLKVLGIILIPSKGRSKRAQIEWRQSTSYWFIAAYREIAMLQCTNANPKEEWPNIVTHPRTSAGPLQGQVRKITKVAMLASAEWHGRWSRRRQ